jgi:hypothetical protein
LLFLSSFQFFASFPQHWTQAATETIWHEKYTNCDMGYAVTLPKDRLLYQQVRDGFHLMTIPRCECSND